MQTFSVVGRAVFPVHRRNCPPTKLTIAPYLSACCMSAGSNLGDDADTTTAAILIAAVMMRPGSDPYVLNPTAHQSYLEMMQELTSRKVSEEPKFERVTNP
jgi:hypothetical protein